MKVNFASIIDKILIFVGIVLMIFCFSKAMMADDTLALTFSLIGGFIGFLFLAIGKNFWND